MWRVKENAANLSRDSISTVRLVKAMRDSAVTGLTGQPSQEPTEFDVYALSDSL